MLVRGRTLAKGQKFDSWRSIGHAAQAARVHAKRGVDELAILDVSATAEGRGPDLDLVRELSDGCFIPISVGGGIRSLADIDALLRAGADKVCIGTAAFESPNLIQDASARFGRQAITAALDIKGGRAWIRCGTAQAAQIMPEGPPGLAKFLEDEGAGEILLNSIERDGMMCGYDLDLIREVSAAVNIPVIASGGCGTYLHMLEAFHAGADAVASGAMFCFTDAVPLGAAKYLKSKGVEVRI